MAGKLDEIIDRDDERKIMLKEAERRLTVRLAIVTALLTAITLLLGYFAYRAQMENHVSFFRSAPRASLSASEELPFQMR